MVGVQSHLTCFIAPAAEDDLDAILKEVELASSGKEGKKPTKKGIGND